DYQHLIDNTATLHPRFTTLVAQVAPGIDIGDTTQDPGQFILGDGDELTDVDFHLRTDSRVSEGDAEIEFTGQPAAGMHILAVRRGVSQIDGGIVAGVAVTDANGHFKISGIGNFFSIKECNIEPPYTESPDSIYYENVTANRFRGDDMHSG